MKLERRINNMHDHIYSYDKIYKYEIIVEPIPESKMYKGYVYLDLYEIPVYKSGECANPETLRDLLITNVTNYLDNFGAIPLTNQDSVIE
jgi:hypothetical protein